MKKFTLFILCALLMIPTFALASGETKVESGEEIEVIEETKLKAEETKKPVLKSNNVVAITGIQVNGGKQQAFVNEKNVLKAQGSAPVGTQYKFVYSYNNWQDWAPIRDFALEDSVEWVPKKIGTYDIYIDIKDTSGKITTVSYKVNVDKTWGFVPSGIPASTKIGESYKVAAAGTGQTGKLKYKFVYSYNNWQDWKAFQDFSTSSTATFVPKMAGDYEIYVDVMDENGVVETKILKTKSSIGWTFNGIEGPSRMAIGNTTTIKASTSSSEGMKYKFVYSYNNWQEWEPFQNFGTSSSASFKPKKPGNYEIFVDAMDSKGNVITKSIKFEVLANWTFSGVSVSTKDADLGETVVIKPVVSGDTAGLKYKFVYSYLDWYKWGTFKNSSLSSTAEFKIDAPGYYKIYVDITDPSGYTVTKSVDITSGGGGVPIITGDWFKSINAALPKGQNYTVVDVLTGKRFTVKRWAGTNHMDAEPLTAKDTAILNEVYGGAWSWARRPIVVINNDKAYAASMNGMPHGVQTISSNGFAGHICIHFNMSRTHGSNRVDPDHKKAVEAAAAKGNVKL